MSPIFGSAKDEFPGCAGEGKHKRHLADFLTWIDGAKNLEIYSVPPKQCSPVPISASLGKETIRDKGKESPKRIRGTV